MVSCAPLPALAAVSGFVRVRSGSGWLRLSAMAPGAVVVVLAMTSGDETSCRCLGKRPRPRIASFTFPGELLVAVSAGLAGGIGAPLANGDLVESAAEGTCVTIGVSSRGGAFETPRSGWVTPPAAGALAVAPSRDAFAVSATSLVAVGEGPASGTGGEPPAVGASAQSPADGTFVAIGVSFGGGETVETGLGSGNCGEGGAAATRLLTVAALETPSAGWVTPSAAGAPAGMPSSDAFVVPVASLVAVSAALSGGIGAPPAGEASGRISAEGTCVAVGVSSDGAETVATGSGSGNCEGRAAAGTAATGVFTVEGPTAACVASTAAGGAEALSSDAFAIPAASLVAPSPGLDGGFEPPFAYGASIKSAAATGSRS